MEGIVTAGHVADVSDIDAMTTSFKRSLKAERKSPQTIMAYTYAPTQPAVYLGTQHPGGGSADERR